MDFTPENKRAENGIDADLIDRAENGQIVGTKGLTDKQRKFVAGYLESGGNRQYAATIAGYSSPDTAAYQMLNNPKIRQALYDARELEIENLASLGLKIARDIMLDTKAPYGVRANLAMHFVDAKHDTKAKQLQSLSTKRIDEMDANELEEHARQLDKALLDMGLMVDITGDTAQQSQQLIEQQQDVSV